METYTPNCPHVLMVSYVRALCPGCSALCDCCQRCRALCDEWKHWPSGIYRPKEAKS